MNPGLSNRYIDFRKAFDSEWREGLWRVLLHLGYTEKLHNLVKILESVHEGTFSVVWSVQCLSDRFETTVGVMQGCVLSPLLFNVFLEAIIGREIADKSEGVVISGNLISNLRFAYLHCLKATRIHKSF